MAVRSACMKFATGGATGMTGLVNEAGAGIKPCPHEPNKCPPRLSTTRTPAGYLFGEAPFWLKNARVRGVKRFNVRQKLTHDMIRFLFVPMLWPLKQQQGKIETRRAIYSWRR